MFWFYLDNERGIPANYPNPREKTCLLADAKSLCLLIKLCEIKKIEYGIDFDYDLDDDFYNGYYVADYICKENCDFCKGFRIHSANKEGSLKIKTLMESNGYIEF